MANPQRSGRLIALIGPGLLVAATGVGAGDLATASFTGSQLGTAVLWAVVLGGFLKFVVTEGLARWQLVTGETFLEGVSIRLGALLGWLFLPYLLLWSFYVGSALMSACGVTLHAMIPVFDDAVQGKIIFGVVSSLTGLLLVWVGGFSLFERVMGVCIGLMFVTVVSAALLLWPGTSEVVTGLLVPVIPEGGGEGLGWTVALMGGVGGTVTILCYGYWIREKQRIGTDEIEVCRIDLGVGYVMTILFGIAMVIIGSTVTIEGGGAELLVNLADNLEAELGIGGRWIFLIGAFGAVYSSLLGVWQAVPYLFADIWRLFLRRGKAAPIVADPIDTTGLPYRAYMVALATLPILGLVGIQFRDAQRLYAITGAAFIPIVALALLVMNGRRAWMGRFANRPGTVMVLAGTLAFFGWVAWTSWVP